LEIRAPQQFSEDRPAVHYSHKQFHTPIEDHPQAKRLPKATASPSVQAAPQDFRIFAARENAPSTLEDFLNSDTPLLSLHVTSFTDATLVGLLWPHTLMDAMGQMALLHGWSLVLAGRMSEIPALLGAREDALRAAVEDSLEEQREEFKLGAMRLTNAPKFWFTWEPWWQQPVVTRTICLPERCVVKLRDHALADLTGGEDTDVFVSEGDALVAWLTRAIFSSLPETRPVTVLNAVNVRSRLASLVEAPGVYVQNMAITGFTFLTVKSLSASLGHIALENRRCLNEQLRESQVLANLRERVQLWKSGSDPSFICSDPNAIPVFSSNWLKADFTKITNFSSAIVSGNGTGKPRSNPPGSIAFHHIEFIGPDAMDAFTIMGKDHGDNYWITARLHAPAWAKLEETLIRM